MVFLKRTWDGNLAISKVYWSDSDWYVVEKHLMKDCIYLLKSDGTVEGDPRVNLKTGILILVGKNLKFRRKRYEGPGWRDRTNTSG